MKINIVEKYPSRLDKRSYPYLGESISGSGFFVLFFAPQKGLVLEAGSSGNIPWEMHDQWVESCFKVSEETLSISND